MKYNVFGRTGLVVSDLCFSTANFGWNGYWENLSKLQAIDSTNMTRLAIEAGINFFDTSYNYSKGESEILFGNALKYLNINRNDVVISTNISKKEFPNNLKTFSRKYIFQSINDSLERLQLQYFDILYVENLDIVDDLEDFLQILNDLVLSGKVLFLAATDCSAWKMMKAIGISQKYGWHFFEAIQLKYSVLEKEADRELIPFIKDQNLGFISKCPLVLSDSFQKQNNIDLVFPNLFLNPENFSFLQNKTHLVDSLTRIAEFFDVSVPQISLAWLQNQETVQSSLILPANTEYLMQIIQSSEIKLSKNDLEELSLHHI